MRTLRTSLGAVTANPRSVGGEPRTSGKSREPVVGDVDPPRNPGVTAVARGAGSRFALFGGTFQMITRL